MTDRCKIIAEAGVNHNGSPELAHRLVDVARSAGADIVKFQTFRAEALVTRGAPRAAYQQAAMGGAESQFEMLRRLELPKQTFRDLLDYCQRVGIEFLSTPFDTESARFLAEAGMKRIKVSSGDLTNIPFLRDLAALDLPIILSTGMADLGETEVALNVLEHAGLSPGRITILHCTTEYPAPVGEVNLRAMTTLSAAFPEVVIGYSDHTEGIDIPIAAIALGARVLEKHFTLDRSMSGPDHKASLEPGELGAMVAAVRRVEDALGDGRKRPTASEIGNRVAARKSIVAATTIRRGEILTTQNLTVRRPGNGLSPARWDEWIGTPAARDFEPGDLL